MNARDRLGNLRCQVPGCRVVIRAMTGLQELVKLRFHLATVHLANKTMSEVLETRAALVAVDARRSTGT